MACRVACPCGRDKAEKTVVKFGSLAPEIQGLLKEAVDARQKAYCPYSKFKVGASLLCADGKTYKGCNIENACFNVGTCAERTACAKAISEGNKKFKAIAVIARQESGFTTPCGACRQFLSEFGNVDIYCAKPDLDDVLVSKGDILLPLAFVSLD